MCKFVIINYSVMTSFSSFFKITMIIIFLLFINICKSQNVKKKFIIHFEETPTTLYFNEFSDNNFHGYMETVFYKKSFLGLFKPKRYTSTTSLSSYQDIQVNDLITELDKSWDYFEIPKSNDKNDYFTISGLSKQKFIKITSKFFFIKVGDPKLEVKNPLRKIQIFHDLLNQEISVVHYLNWAISCQKKGTYYYFINNNKFFVRKFKDY